jgi:hypothetical protein
MYNNWRTDSERQTPTKKSLQLLSNLVHLQHHFSELYNRHNVEIVITNARASCVQHLSFSVERRHSSNPFGASYCREPMKRCMQRKAQCVSTK